MAKKYIITHDLGTSNNKACLFSTDGKLVCEAQASYPVYYGTNGEAEQDPADWWRAFVDTTKRVLAQSAVKSDQVKIVTFSAQMNSLVAVDKQGELVSERVMTWLDVRSKEQADFIGKHYGVARHNRLTGAGQDMSVMYFTKLMWLRQHQPEVYEKIHKVLGAKEYMVMRLTGEFGFGDFAQAAGSGTFDITKERFDEELLELTGIPHEMLGDVVPPTTVIGTVLPAVAEQTGLSQNTQVVLGLTDDIAGFIGASGMQNGTMVTNYGTGPWLSIISSFVPEARDDSQIGVSYMGGGTYSLSLHVTSSGAVTDWALRNLLQLDKSNAYELAENMANQSVPGAGGVMLNPSFVLGNARHSGKKMEGALFGLKLNTTKNDIARAVYEATTLDLYECYHDIFLPVGIAAERISMIGGGGKSALQRKVLANVFDLPVVIQRPEIIQNAGAVGAFMTACIGAGLYSNYEEMVDLFPPEQILEPSTELVNQYKEHAQRYFELSRALACAY